MAVSTTVKLKSHPSFLTFSTTIPAPEALFKAIMAEPFEISGILDNAHAKFLLWALGIFVSTSSSTDKHQEYLNRVRDGSLLDKTKILRELELEFIAENTGKVSTAFMLSATGIENLPNYDFDTKLAYFLNRLKFVLYSLGLSGKEIKDKLPESLKTIVGDFELVEGRILIYHLLAVPDVLKTLKLVKILFYYFEFSKLGKEETPTKYAHKYENMHTLSTDIIKSARNYLIENELMYFEEENGTPKKLIPFRIKVI